MYTREVEGGTTQRCEMPTCSPPMHMRAGSFWLAQIEARNSASTMRANIRDVRARCHLHANTHKH